MLYAVLGGVFKGIKFMGLGVQIDVYAERMTDVQLGVFCLVGALATFCAGLLLTVLAEKICRVRSKLFRAIFYSCFDIPANEFCKTLMSIPGYGEVPNGQLNIKGFTA